MINLRAQGQRVREHLFAGDGEKGAADTGHWGHDSEQPGSLKVLSSFVGGTL
jgi:hypothetical protein